jgi:hypothetical protein
MSVAKAVGVVLLVLVVACGLGWLAQGNQFFMYKFFAPREEQVRRETFENTRSFNEGMAQELQQIHMDYAKAKAKKDQAGMDLLAETALQRTAGYEISRLPSSTQQFINDLRTQRGL